MEAPSILVIGAIQTLIPETTLLILILIMVVAVISVAVALILLRRRSHRGYYPTSYPILPQPEPQPIVEGPPTATALEMLRRDLEEVASAHSSGLMNVKDVKSRLLEIRRSLEDLRQYMKIVKKTKTCNSCGMEIEVEAKFCDRCGAKQ
ncbi:MAG: zinc ribbon domain-containing protein [Candidatus Bathyarchaeia archaeon]